MSNNIDKKKLIDWLESMMDSNKIPFPDSEAAYWMTLKKIQRGEFDIDNSITELAINTLKELERYTAPDYPFKSAETIAEFHTLIELSLEEINVRSGVLIEEKQIKRNN